ncbi:hypothetical protein DFAR_3690001 [Desulfarculales bacterium]
MDNTEVKTFVVTSSNVFEIQIVNFVSSGAVILRDEGHRFHGRWATWGKYATLDNT